MKKIIRLFVLAFALTIATFTLASCNTEVKNEKVAAEAIKLLLVEQEPVVEKDFSVGGLVSYKGVSYPVTWASNNECIPSAPLNIFCILPIWLAKINFSS